MMILSTLALRTSAQEPVYRVLIKVKHDERSGRNGKAVLDLPGSSTTTIRPLYPKIKNSSSARTPSIENEYYLIITPYGSGLDSLLHHLRLEPSIEYAEPDAIGYHATVQPLQDPVFPDDTYFAQQWSLNNDGSFTASPAKPDADADLPEAWTLTQGNADITVAILDSGIKTDHPEFTGRIWINTEEVPGNGVDDDGNGYADDVQGWNMTQENGNVMDTRGHGTHVAGIIGANGNNNIGYAGVDWNCKLMICKVLEDDLTGYYSWWAQAIHYAVDNGADIINMSLGGTTYSRTLEDAVNYARRKNVLVIASMQNHSSDEVNYPAGYSSVIAVGSTDPDDQRSRSFSGTGIGSNFGNHIDIVAPGNFIFGISYQSNTNYNFMLSGTSQAAPLVSGIAALVLASEGPMKADDLERRILSSAEDGVGNPEEDTPGWDRYYGFGRINAYRALAEPIDERRPIHRTPLAYPNPSTGELTVTLDQGEVVPYTLSLINNTGQVLKKIHEQTSRTIDQTFSLHDLPTGVYFLEIRTPRSSKYVRWVKY